MSTEQTAAQAELLPLSAGQQERERIRDAQRAIMDGYATFLAKDLRLNWEEGTREGKSMLRWATFGLVCIVMNHLAHEVQRLPDDLDAAELRQRVLTILDWREHRP